MSLERERERESESERERERELLANTREEMSLSRDGKKAARNCHVGRLRNARHVVFKIVSRDRRLFQRRQGGMGPGLGRGSRRRWTNRHAHVLTTQRPFCCRLLRNCVSRGSIRTIDGVLRKSARVRETHHWTSQDASRPLAIAGCGRRRAASRGKPRKWSPRVCRVFFSLEVRVESGVCVCRIMRVCVEETAALSREEEEGSLSSWREVLDLRPLQNGTRDLCVSVFYSLSCAFLTSGVGSVCGGRG